MCYTELMYMNSLCHYGTQGMKWGVRRYQYDDGRYTPEGEQRRLAKIHGGVYKSNGGREGIGHKIKSKYHETKTNLKHLSKDQKKAIKRYIVTKTGKKIATAAGLAAAGLGAKYLYARGGYKLVGKALSKASPRAQMIAGNMPNLVRGVKRATRKPVAAVAGGAAIYNTGKAMDRIINKGDTSINKKTYKSKKAKKIVKKNSNKKVSEIKNKKRSGNIYTSDRLVSKMARNNAKYWNKKR